MKKAIVVLLVIVVILSMANFVAAQCDHPCDQCVYKTEECQRGMAALQKRTLAFIREQFKNDPPSEAFPNPLGLGDRAVLLLAFNRPDNEKRGDMGSLLWFYKNYKPMYDKISAPSLSSKNSSSFGREGDTSWRTGGLCRSCSSPIR